MPAELNEETIRLAPKVLLHDHLDGGLRPQTIIDLADSIGYQSLPSHDADELGQWFKESANSGSLVRYLETFDHTVAVMQTRDGLHRVASECAQDLAADGVVYAEVRWAPEQHVSDGLRLYEVIEATLEGFAHGVQAASEAGRQIRIGALATAMRHAARSREIAELAVAYRDRGVVGFDIAGAEAGFPPTRHLDAFEYLRRENFHFTIHAGEAFGLPSIWEAIQWCGADRLGHGVRIIDDIAATGANLEHQSPRADRPAGAVRPGQADPAGDLPVLERADRRCRLHRRAPDRAAAAAALPGHGQHRQPVDERHVDDPGDGAAGRGVRLRPGRTCSG